MRSYLLACVVLLGCDEVPGGPHYYERVIQPILTNSCVRNTAGCHKDDGTGNAFGNVDMTSYAALTRRRDILRTFGSYPVPLLLLKASGAQVPPIPYKGAGDGSMTVTLPSQIDHVGLATISVDSQAYLTLQRWMESGANQDGATVVRERQTGNGACRKDFDVMRPDVAAQVGTVDVNSPAFQHFAANVEPVLAQSCAYGTCHSSQQSDFFLACRGSGSDDLSKFNFLEAQQYVAATQEGSLILQKPLAPSAGGISHTGGVFFVNKDDADWKALAAWAKEVGPQVSGAALTEGERFFRDQVMPVFLQRGCALEACHSPGSANDFKLRAGTPGGFFSPFSLSFNYHEARDNFLVADIPDPRQTRIVKKPVIRTADGGVGLVHRGGPPLQSATDPTDLDPTACPQPWSSASGAYCTLVEWHRIERQALLTAGEADAFGTRMPLVVVVRPANDDRLIDFDNYRPGADLRLGSVGMDALGLMDEGSATDDASLIANCAGVAGGNADVRHPAVSLDASRVAFAMRLSQNDSLDVYEVTLNAAHTCTKITDGNGMSQNGIKIHNLDPMYAFDGSLVFASTRGRPGVGPTRSLKFLLPQTDLWRMRPNGTGYGAAEQMTVLLGSELNPQMMLNGEVTFTAEKASADFYQLSGRRINWDLTDYHPLLGQRAKSPSIRDGDVSPGSAMTPSVGFSQATDIREGIDRNFVLIFSDVGARGGGGTLATFNRSLGPFEADRSDINFLGAVVIFDPAATGRAGATQGAYRSPFSLPDGRYLVSYDPAITDLAAQTPRYDLVVFDPRTGRRSNVSNFAGPGASRVEAALVYKRQARPMFDNLTQLVFGGHAETGDAGHAIVHYPDLPMLGTLLGANLRTGRFVDRLRPAKKVAVYEDQAPPSDLAAAMAGLSGSQMVYQNRKHLGTVDLHPEDGSVRLMLPSMTPLILELLDGNDGKLFTMAEEDQLGPGERISRGVPQKFFNSVCGGCHGAVSGVELEIALDPDALTQASVSKSRDVQPTQVGP